ncbi:MAG: ribonuclease R [Lachnospiraceae bacterium]|nr:ribonuclease R [Lachnospiraceae bacterium]
MDIEQNEKRKKMILDFVKEPEYKPMKLKELAFILQVADEDRGVLRKILNELVDSGQLDVDSKGRYMLAERGVYQGTFIGNAKGFGFVEIEGEKDDVFIPESAVNGAMHNDTVLVKVEKEKQGDRRREGVIKKIIARGMEEIVGTFKKSGNYGFVVSDISKFNRDIYIPAEKTKNAVDGHKVVVKLHSYGEKDKNPEGEVIEILGHANDPGVDIISIVRALGIPDEYPKSVMKQVESVPDEVESSKIGGRLDLRDEMMVTIDGEDAKDLDDAIHLKRTEKGYELGVHIADVSEYVTEGSPLDKEALKRGTSVYLVDRVIPMLPHALSNGICSLNQGVDRLALSCIMQIDSKGKVYDHKIAETVVKIDRRMTYTAVNAIITDHDEATMKEYEEFVPMFELMKEVSELLRDRRMKRGSIDFDFPESKILLDEKGVPYDIKPYERNAATKLIEDFMLMANETIAENYFWLEMPFVYRTHESPDAEKIAKLSTMIANFGYFIKDGGDELHPKEFQKLLGKIEGTPEEALISRLTLRSMKQAKYTTECTGHFGLAARYYCHFTSPIRRYPDLQIHRIIKEHIHGKMNDKRINHYEKILNDVANSSSKNERRADEAEREVDKLKKVQYMTMHIGEEFTGTISSITSWGMYVELPNTVEGMISVNSLIGDYFYYDEESYKMIGKDSHREFNLGQTVIVKCENADMETRTIDFVLVEGEEENNG